MMATRLRRAEQVERNRELLLTAAREVFLERGYAGASLEAVAEHAGFSKGVVYSQFGSKVDLFMVLLRARIDERAAHNERVTAGLSGAEGIRVLMRDAARDQLTDAGWARLLVEFRSLAMRDPTVNRRYAEAHERTVTRLTSVLAGLHERAGRSPAVSPRTMAQLILALGAGLTLERAADATALPEDEMIALLPGVLGLSDAPDAARRSDSQPRRHTGPDRLGDR